MKTSQRLAVRTKHRHSGKRFPLLLGGMLIASLAGAQGGCAAFARPTPQPTPVSEATLPTTSVPTASEAPAPVETPVPEIAPTGTPTAGQEMPTDTPLPLPLAPTATATPTSEFPQAEIQIFTPGPLSRVVSPLRARALLEPGSRGHIQVELIGEDGRLLVRQLLVYTALPGRRVNVSLELEFEIAAVAETGRLQFSTSDRFGRNTRLASVAIILLSSGEADINPPGDLLAPILIQEPPEEQLIQGGEMRVSGLARPTSEQPLVIELIDPEGKMLGSRQVAVADSPQTGHRPFETTLLYAVSEPTRALLVVRERGDRIPGTTQLTSKEIFVSP